MRPSWEGTAFRLRTKRGRVRPRYPRSQSAIGIGGRLLRGRLQIADQAEESVVDFMSPV